MDPVCHTLVGGALAESGLKRRTAYGLTTLLLAANAPDLDVLTYLEGPTTALWLRRGMTHGVLAWIVLPLLVTSVVLVAEHVLRRGEGQRRVVPMQVLALAFVGVLTHPVLDLLNTYGVRLLMPFSDRWFYGDVLFIADPWVWGILATGVVWSRRRAQRGVGDATGARAAGRPAQLALLALVLYLGVMTGSNLVARRIVTSVLRERGLPVPEHVMVAPVPVDPLHRRVVVEVDGAYWGGRLSFLGTPRVLLENLGLSRDPDVRTVAATRGPEARRFLAWARFPYFELASAESGDTVLVGDARYTLRAQGSWASVSIPVGGAPGP